MRTLRNLLRNPSGAIGVVLTGLLLLAFLLSFLWTPYGVEDVDPAASWAPPSTQHLLGADNLGRDVFSMMLVGSRVTLEISVGAALIALVLGLLLASAIVYTRRPWSVLFERLTDVGVAFPILIVALIIVTAFGGSTASSMVAIGLGSTPSMARVVLPELRRATKADYVLLAAASGASRPWILWRHIFPDLTPTLIVAVTQIMGTAALAEAGLSYLGLGTPPPTPSWGRMLSAFQQYIYTRPQVIFVPGLAIVAVIIGFNLLGDGLRDVLDPRSKK
ncbi:ABC transporter permease [Neoactinobaculum massilliense]|uniref:ABC transporter permease n=1 Tax=Neoactinobaculum massilliense TaxID=2364794 RepID=UPI000F51D092|nr:ABC transporter permease [Neoactinobaculum massilliense]